MTALSAGELARFRATACEAAARGAQVLLEQRTRLIGLAARSKGRRRELVTEADRAAERAVVGCLLEACPDHAVLAEEGALTPVGRPSSDSDHLWIVDPLDGTTNFVHGLPYFAVAVALAHAGEIVVGVVAAPALGETFAATRGGGAFLGDRPISVSATGELADALLCTGFSYNRNEPGRDDNTARFRRALLASRDVRRFGSAELDLCHVAAGRCDAYWEMYLAPYDVAAGALIVREAGGTVTDLAGGDDWLYGEQIAASNGRLHRELLGLVGGPPAGNAGPA